MTGRRLVIPSRICNSHTPVSNEVWPEVCYFYRQLAKAVNEATATLADKVKMLKWRPLPSEELRLKQTLAHLIYINNPITDPPLVRRIGADFYYYAPKDEIVRYAVIPYYTYISELQQTRDLPDDYFSGQLTRPSEVESELAEKLGHQIQGFAGFYNQWAKD